jgi:hypothetical protein
MWKCEWEAKEVVAMVQRSFFMKKTTYGNKEVVGRQTNMGFE